MAVPRRDNERRRRGPPFCWGPYCLAPDGRRRRAKTEKPWNCRRLKDSETSSGHDHLVPRARRWLMQPPCPRRSPSARSAGARGSSRGAAPCRPAARRSVFLTFRSGARRSAGAAAARLSFARAEREILANCPARRNVHHRPPMICMSVYDIQGDSGRAKSKFPWARQAIFLVARPKFCLVKPELITY